MRATRPRHLSVTAISAPYDYRLRSRARSARAQFLYTAYDNLMSTKGCFNRAQNSHAASARDCEAHDVAAFAISICTLSKLARWHAARAPKNHRGDLSRLSRASSTRALNPQEPT